MFDKIQIPDSVQLPKGKRACRRQANELRAAHQLHRQFAAFAREVGELPNGQAQSNHRQLFNEDDLGKKIKWLRELSGDSQQALLKSLEKLEKTGPWRNVARAPSPKALEGLDEDFPNFSAVTTLIQQRLLLCSLAPSRHIKLPPILLNGPAGVGKTAYCQRLACLLGLRSEKIDLSSGAASFALTGLDAGYATGHPGQIWESLQHDSLSVLWILDEVEKVKKESPYGGNQFLLGLLEPISATKFVDSYTLLPIDASWICYIAICNEKSLMDAPLQSRFEIFDIPVPDTTQLFAIVRSIYRGIRSSEAWAPVFNEVLGEDVIGALASHTPREIRRLLIGGFATAAVQSRRTLIASDIDTTAGQHSRADRRIGFI